MGESIGTLILVLLGDGVCVAMGLNKSKAQASGWIVIALGWGFVIAVAVYIPGFTGSVHLNPAVSLAMAMTGAISWNFVVPFIVTQVLGAFAGTILVWLSYLSHQNATKDGSAILGTFATGPAIRNYPANVITELIGTLVLVLGLLAFRQNEFAPGTNVFAVGGLILAIGPSLGGPAGYATNPVRDFDPRLAHAVLPIANKGTLDWAYSWTSITGPMIGAIITVGVYPLAVQVYKTYQSLITKMCLAIVKWKINKTQKNGVCFVNVAGIQSVSRIVSRQNLSGVLMERYLSEK